MVNCSSAPPLLVPCDCMLHPWRITNQHGRNVHTDQRPVTLHHRYEMPDHVDWNVRNSTFSRIRNSWMRPRKGCNQKTPQSTLIQATTAEEGGSTTGDATGKISTPIMRAQAEQIASLAKTSATQTAAITNPDEQLTSQQRVRSVTNDSDDRSARLVGREKDLVATLHAITDPEGIYPVSKSPSSLIQDLEDRCKKAAKGPRRADREIAELTNEWTPGED